MTVGIDPEEMAERKLARLRADISLGLAELDAGLGAEIDIEEFIRQMREEFGDQPDKP